MIFYTADPHFGHANIIKYCKRPFVDVEHQDGVLIDNWNAKVGDKDTVYVLGDFAFKRENFEEVIPQLNGKIIFIPGNHDIKVQRKLKTTMPQEWHGKVEFTDRDILPVYDVMEGEKKYVVICHYPMKTWNRKYHGALHLYGHEHGTVPKYDTHAFDVGVDVWGFQPVTLEEIIISEWSKGKLYERHTD